VLEAFDPTTIYHDPYQTIWEDVTITVTVLNRTITYMDGTNIDTIVTEYETLTRNLTLPANQTVIYTTPIFTWVPAVGTTLTLDVGPTYIAYTQLYGGLDFPWVDPTNSGPEGLEPVETEAPTPTQDWSFPDETDFFLPEDVFEPEQTCDAQVNPLPIGPTETQEYRYFIQTVAAIYTDVGPDVPMSLPPALIEHLKSNSAITSIFNGSDIATCTLRMTSHSTPRVPTTTLGFPVFSSFTGTPPAISLSAPPEFPGDQPTSTYFSSTYESISTHITVQGCLRCPNKTKDPVSPATNPTGDGLRPSDSAQAIKPPNSQQPPVSPKPSTPQQTQGNPQGTRGNPGGKERPTNLPGVIASVINDPQFTQNPRPQPNDNTQHITIGDGVVEIRPARPTQPNQQNNPSNPNNPNSPNRPQQEQQNPQRQNPGVIIGSETLTPGQTTTINGVQVIVPTQADGNNNNNIIVDGSTIAVNPVPTGPPVLTVGDTTVTANPQGQFVVGTQTLVPGGPPITADGSTLSLGPSGSIAVVNGVTQTLANAPFATQAPVLTVNGETISATVVGGTTQFVLAPGQTLTPGGVLTVDGTTFSLPSSGSGSTIVINGVTSTLTAPGLPIITVNGQAVTASVSGGTTAFILAPGQTLTPGGVLTVDGTTFSLPESASGSVVVINGVTSTLGQPASITAAPSLTIDGNIYAATVRDGTTEYVLGEGTTLQPGGVVTLDGTTYSLDEEGTALIVNGKTSSIPNGPARNTATTTRSSSTGSSTTSQRDPGNFIASGIGISDEPGGAVLARGGGLDVWAEGVVVAVAGWVLMLV
jgi:hypothetical protein